MLEEPRHALIIYRALNDPDTIVEPGVGNDPDWCFYGPEEALLVQPSSTYLKILLFIYHNLIIINSS